MSVLITQTAKTKNIHIATLLHCPEECMVTHVNAWKIAVESNDAFSPGKMKIENMSNILWIFTNFSSLHAN